MLVSSVQTVALTMRMAAHTTLNNSSTPQIKRVDDLRGDVSRLELSLGAAKAEYDKIKAANLSETARFAAERRAEYTQMLENFTATQVRQEI